MTTIKLLLLALVSLLLVACNAASGHQDIKDLITRYNALVSQGYRTFNMNPLQEVTTPEQATKLYYHMAALGEGRLRMEATLKKIDFTKMAVQGDKATVETRETWDFSHLEIKTGKKFAEEKDYVYEMAYILNRKDGRWLIMEASTIAGKSTNTVTPWPAVQGKRPQQSGLPRTPDP